MDKSDDMGGNEIRPEMPGIPGIPGDEEQGVAAPQPEPVRVERKRRKVSLIAAIVINVITVITVAIVMLAVLLPGYRRSFTIAKAVEGADDVWIVVRTSEANMRNKSTDFIRAQDSLKNALQELVGGENRVRAYVRDNYPDQAWIEENLPEAMMLWLQGLFPEVEQQPRENNIPEGETTGSGTTDTQQQ